MCLFVGEVYVFIESFKGELGFFIYLESEFYLYRLKIRVFSFYYIGVLSDILVG